MTQQEKKEKYLNYLVKIGFLIKYNNLELYHGRCEKEGESWQVRSDIDNSFNVTRDNIMGIPCLCVASYDVAQSYASGTSLGGRTGKMKVYKVVCLDDVSFVINESFDIDKFSGKDRLKFIQEMQAFAQGALRSYCNKLENGSSILQEITASLNKEDCIYQKDEDRIIDDLNVKGYLDKEVIKKVCGAINSNSVFIKDPIQSSSRYVFGKQDERTVGVNKNNKFTLNQDLVSLIMKKNNIIGLKKKNRAGFDQNIVYVFNMAKVQAFEANIDKEKE